MVSRQRILLILRRFTWLIVAAETREFTGIMERTGAPNDRWMLAANGPGPRLVVEAIDQALRERRQVDGIVSTGFCGALDPLLGIGDIVVSGDGVASPRPFVRGQILSLDRVAVTAEEKRNLHEATGAVAVEMESDAVALKARELGVPFRCIKVVSDTAAEDMPLDFNQYRDSAGRFSRPRIAFGAMFRPFTAIPALLRLDRNCRHAADKLGEFFADCQL
jgi:adenosylhomocysteine nucleosidase